MAWIDRLLEADAAAWRAINGAGPNAVLDALVPLIRNQFFWAPLYLFLLLFTLANGGRKALWWMAGFLVAFALADSLSASLVKPVVARIRPCNEPSLRTVVRLLVPCGGGYSFPSSHATNHTAMGVYLAATLGRRWRWLWVAGIGWGGSVGLAQVYVGVHYPLDVAGGMLLGGLIGWMIGALVQHPAALGHRWAANLSKRP